VISNSNNGSDDDDEDDEDEDEDDDDVGVEPVVVTQPPTRRFVPTQIFRDETTESSRNGGGNQEPIL
jgi:hypothetical protein